MEENKNGIGLLPLVAIIVSGAIGGGVFNLTMQLAKAATPGGVLVSWLVIGIGILMLVLALNHLVINKPELSGVSDYAKAGFGDLAGFISGWGYWLSAWLGNIAFAVLLMTSVGYFLPGFTASNGSLTLLAVIVVSIVMWALTVLVIRGVESAAVINAIVLVAKLIPLLVFVVIGIAMFKSGVFTAHFWQNFTTNVDKSGAITSLSFSNMKFSDLINFSGGLFGGQITSSLMFMIWVFVGIEGAAMMGDRAKKKSDAGKASIIGFIALLVIYGFLSILPFGFMSQTDLAKLNNSTTPGLVQILNHAVPGLGWIMALGLIITLLGAWLSWTMLPVEATQQLADQKLLPKWFGVQNEKKAPQNSLLLTAVLMQIFIIITYFSANAYNVFVYLCTAVIMICYLLVGLYLFKLGIQEHKTSNIVIGLLAWLFQAFALYASGWIFIWASSIIYVIGFAFFYMSKTENKLKMKTAEMISMVVITLLAIFADLDLLLGWGGTLDLRTALGLDASSMAVVYVLTVLLAIGLIGLIYGAIKNSQVKEIN